MEGISGVEGSIGRMRRVCGAMSGYWEREGA